MHRMTNRIARCRLELGFTVIEVLVAGLVLVVGLVMMSQFFASAMGRVLDSDIRSVLHQVAAEEIEQIRGLPYDDVGTTTGHPQGTLLAEEERTIQNGTVNMAVLVYREIIYWTDPSYTGPYPANYRRVTVIVSAVGQDHLAPVEMTTNVAGGAPGGTLDITVTDIGGSPVPDALITVTNNNLIPHVNISGTAFRTDSQGRMIIPGLTPDATPGYFVSVSKSGYNTDSTDTGCVVQDGLPYTVVKLTIDRLATMVVRVVDTEGTAVEGLNLSIIGPEGFNQTLVSSASGTTFADIRYSTDLDPYVVRLLPGQGYDEQSQSVILAPGSNREVLFTVPVGGPTTTTTTIPTTTTTVTVPTSTTTTTLSGWGSLTVRVVRSDTGAALSGAWISLGGINGTTNEQGYYTFSRLEKRTYEMVVTRNHYHDYQGTVVVNGAVTTQVSLVRD
jgi:hypothetical protein